MHRFYAQDAPAEGLVRLSPEDARHARCVLRMKPGDPLEIFLNEERWSGAVHAVEEDGVTARLLETLPSTEARLRLTLFQGLPKAEKMEWIVQKAVELGAEAVVPVAMSRCVARLDAKDGAKKRERWQKIAREAGKQSGRCKPLAVSAPVSFKAMAELLPGFDTAIVPWEDERGYSLTALRREKPDIRTLAVVIGPEGGISPGEIEALAAAGCQSVTLGRRILRTETAGLCALSALMCLYGEME